MAVTRLFTPRPYDVFDPAISGVAPILATGTDVDNTKLTAVQAAAVAAGLGTLPTSAGGTAPTPVAEPLRFRGPWQASTAYSYGDVVSQAGILYVAPVSFTSGGSFVAANWTPLGLADASVATSQQSGTTYTLTLGDAGTVVECTNASPVTVTVPPNSSVAYPIGTVINIYAAGAGGVTVAAGAGVTIDNNSTAMTQFGECSLRKRATDEWVRLG